MVYTTLDDFGFPLKQATFWFQNKMQFDLFKTRNFTLDHFIQRISIHTGLVSNTFQTSSSNRSSKILRSTGTKNLGLRGVTPQKLISFGPPHMDNFAIFLDFSYFFSCICLPPWNIRGVSPLTENFRRGYVPPSPALHLPPV